MPAIVGVGIYHHYSCLTCSDAYQPCPWSMCLALFVGFVSLVCLFITMMDAHTLFLGLVIAVGCIPCLPTLTPLVFVRPCLDFVPFTLPHHLPCSIHFYLVGTAFKLLPFLLVTPPTLLPTPSVNCCTTCCVYTHLVDLFYLQFITHAPTTTVETGALLYVNYYGMGVCILDNAFPLPKLCPMGPSFCLVPEACSPCLLLFLTYVTLRPSHYLTDHASVWWLHTYHHTTPNLDFPFFLGRTGLLHVGPATRFNSTTHPALCATQAVRAYLCPFYQTPTAPDVVPLPTALPPWRHAPAFSLLPPLPTYPPRLGTCHHVSSQPSQFLVLLNGPGWAGIQHVVVVSTLLPLYLFPLVVTTSATFHAFPLPHPHPELHPSTHRLAFPFTQWELAPSYTHAITPHVSVFHCILQEEEGGTVVTFPCYLAHFWWWLWRRTFPHPFPDWLPAYQQPVPALPPGRRAGNLPGPTVWNIL